MSRPDDKPLGNDQLGDCTAEPYKPAIPPSWEFEPFTFGPAVLPSFDDRCPECGGMGEIVLGDGGGPKGEATATGCTYPCDACDGTGMPPLVAEAHQALKLQAETGDDNG